MNEQGSIEERLKDLYAEEAPPSQAVPAGEIDERARARLAVGEVLSLCVPRMWWALAIMLSPRSATRWKAHE